MTHDARGRANPDTRAQGGVPALLRDADAGDLPREDLDNFMDGVVDDEDRESMTLGGVRIPIRGRKSRLS